MKSEHFQDIHYRRNGWCGGVCCHSARIPEACRADHDIRTWCRGSDWCGNGCRHGAVLHHDFEFRIWTLETSRQHGPIWGDANELGPLQITEEAWQDAIEHRPEIGGVWGDCQDLGYSLKIMRSYLDRWATVERCGAVNDQVRSRIWNGGPDGWRKESTWKYWVAFCHVPPM